jgi:hypothetical protein
MATKNHRMKQTAALAEKVIAGTNEHLAALSTVIVQGKAYTPAEVVQQLQTLVDRRRDVEAAKAATKAKLVAEATDAVPARALLRAMVLFLRGAFADTPAVLATFGITSKPRAPLTVAARVAAAAKNKATRAARHTMGRREKQKVKGDVTGVVIEPVSSPAAAAAPSADAGSVTTPGP